MAQIDAHKKKILASRREDVDSSRSNDLYRTPFLLEAEPYRLSPKIAAFAVQDHTRHFSCSRDPFSRRINLYVIEGQEIRQVLGSVLQGWSYPISSCPPSNAWPPVQTLNVSISVEPSMTNGVHDVRLTAERSYNAPFGVIVKYDGKRYDTRPWEDFLKASIPYGYPPEN